MNYTKFIYRLYRRNLNKNQKIMSALIAYLGIACLIFIQCAMLYNINKHNYEELSKAVLNNIALILQENKIEKENRIKDYHRYAIEDINDMTTIVDLNHIPYNDTKTFERFSSISMLTELSIYDKNGIKIGGLKPEEYGSKLTDDGIKSKFTPLLDGIKNDMCIDGTDGSNSMYAAAWNHDKNYILVIGVDLDDEYYQDEFAPFDMKRLINHMSLNDDMDVIVIAPDEDKVYASTNKDYADMSIKDMGIKHISLDKNADYSILGDNYYGYFKVIDGYKIGVIKSNNVVDEDIIISVVITVAYLIVFFFVLRMLFSISMNIVKSKERKEARLENEANNDGMTGLYNRRAYERELASYDYKNLKEDLVVVAIDINGLKKANDSLGHEAGDELIMAAAKCVQIVFEPYGNVYRTGGDEFVAIISADEYNLDRIKIDLKKKCKEWHGELVEKLSLSVGYAPVREFADKNISELVKIADENMYKAKQEHYRRTNTSR